MMLDTACSEILLNFREKARKAADAIRVNETEAVPQELHGPLFYTDSLAHDADIHQITQALNLALGVRGGFYNRHSLDVYRFDVAHSDDQSHGTIALNFEYPVTPMRLERDMKRLSDFISDPQQRLER